MKRTITAIFASLATVVLMIGLAVRPALYTQAVLDALSIWATKVLPAMLPYFILTRMLTNYGCVPAAAKLLSPITAKLYRVPGVGGYAYLMSMISGYPVGAKVTLDLYRNGAVDSLQATRMSTFTSTSGPLFILGTVATLFGSYRIGLVILLSHLLAAAVNGLIYRNFGHRSEPPPIRPIPPSEKSDAVYSSVVSVLLVGGYIALFFVLATFLKSTGLLRPVEWLFGQLSTGFGLPFEFGEGLATGLLEVTKGCVELAAFAPNHPLATAVAATCLVSFGGACIQMQGWTYLKDAGVKGWVFALSKITHAVISAVFAFMFGSFIIA